jgi:hypothetical protein
MNEVIVGIQGKLKKEGERDIDLFVHNYYIGRPSPCVVIEDQKNRFIIGGHIDSVEQIFELQAAKRHGYAVKERREIVAAAA